MPLQAEKLLIHPPNKRVLGELFPPPEAVRRSCALLMVPAELFFPPQATVLLFLILLSCSNIPFAFAGKHGKK